MFVKSFMDVEVTYRKSAGDTVLKPRTVTFVDESIVSAKELKDCYGDKISIIPDTMEETIIREAAKIEKEPEVTKDVMDSIEKVPEDKVEKDQVQDVVDFLEGNTDNLPEGTEVITNKEAEELVKKTEEGSSKKTEPKKATGKKGSRKGKNK